MTGFVDRLADGRDLLGRAEAGRVEAVGAGPLERLESRDRVVEVRVAAEVVLGPRGEHEREGESPRRLHRSGDPLDRVVEVVEPAGRVVVLDRAADRARLRDAA